jgi:bifunctional DNA-binding transcriptional regulator/antitoxin component of YhaV-PrlF toxin-antitoxin module
MNTRVLKVSKKTLEALKELKELKKLQKFDKLGKIYIPKHIRDQFRDCRFYIDVIDGKIVLDPVKIEYVDEEESSGGEENGC